MDSILAAVSFFVAWLSSKFGGQVRVLEIVVYVDKAL